MLKYIAAFAGQAVAAVSAAAQVPADSATVRLVVRHAGAPVAGAVVRVERSPADSPSSRRAEPAGPGELVLRPAVLRAEG